MRRVGLGIGLAVLCGIAACRLLLPDGMVVRGPILSSLLGRGIDAPSESVVQGRFRVAAGYSVELFAEGVPNARVMRFSPGGSLIVSQPRKGQLLHIHGDADGDDPMGDTSSRATSTNPTASTFSGTRSTSAKPARLLASPILKPRPTRSASPESPSGS